MVTCFECDNDRSKIDHRSLNSPINRFRFGSRFTALICSNLVKEGAMEIAVSFNILLLIPSSPDIDIGKIDDKLILQESALLTSL